MHHTHIYINIFLILNQNKTISIIIFGNEKKAKELQQEGKGAYIAWYD